jgi:hypothetical protein
MEVVRTKKNKHERAPSTLKKVFTLIEIPLLKIDQVVHGKGISTSASPYPKNKAMKRQLNVTIRVG